MLSCQLHSTLLVVNNLSVHYMGNFLRRLGSDVKRRIRYILYVGPFIPCISLVKSHRCRLSNHLFASILPSSTCPLQLVESSLYQADEPTSNCHKSNFRSNHKSYPLKTALRHIGDGIKMYTHFSPFALQNYFKKIV